MLGILNHPATRRANALAALAAAGLLLLVMGVLPSCARPLPPLQPFLTMYATAVFLVECLTAYFLGIQFFANKNPFLGGLAGAYGFAGVTALLQILVFPGIFAPHGLFSPGPQCAIWIWVIWHLGFPVFVMLALALRLPGLPEAWQPGLARLGVGLMVAGPLCALAGALAAIEWSGDLPPLIAGASYALLRHSPMAPLVVTLWAAALLACLAVTRLNSLLTLWFSVALFAGLLDVVLVLLASARFSLGWYVGRGISVVSSSIVLCVLIFEFSRLYGQLVESNRGLAARALRDGMTGAFNRLYLIEQFPREIGRAARQRKPLSVLMVDVDHFKAYNDVRGHQRGDEVLIAIVAALQGALRRPADFVARYGGEEFIVVLPDTPSPGAAVMAQIIRRAVAELGLRRDDSAAGLVTVSIGVATFDPQEDNFNADELVSRADHALYQAKEAGRDRVCVFSGPAAPADLRHLLARPGAA